MAARTRRRRSRKMRPVAGYRPRYGRPRNPERLIAVLRRAAELIEYRVGDLSLAEAAAIASDWIAMWGVECELRALHAVTAPLRKLVRPEVERRLRDYAEQARIGNGKAAALSGGCAPSPVACSRPLPAASD
jgi:hypothetical protein